MQMYFSHQFAVGALVGSSLSSAKANARLRQALAFSSSTGS
jgi:hypothetical protein